MNIIEGSIGERKKEKKTYKHIMNIKEASIGERKKRKLQRIDIHIYVDG